MRNWRQGLLLATALLVFVLGFSLVTHLRSSPTSEDNVAVATTNGEEPAQPEETVALTANDKGSAETVAALKNDGKPVSEEQAVKIAGDLLGVGPAARYTVKRDTVTDKTLPFVEVIDLPVWTITFEGLAVTFPGAAGPKPEFSTLTCLVDIRTGALLKVLSPLPAAGAVYTEAHPEVLDEKRKKYFTPMKAYRLAKAGVKPLLPLLPELEKQHKGTVQPAKQVVAYFGLYTGNNIKDVNLPCWQIKTGGLDFPFLHGDVNDVNFDVDATTGKAFGTEFSGKSDGTAIPR